MNNCKSRAKKPYRSRTQLFRFLLLAVVCIFLGQCRFPFSSCISNHQVKENVIRIGEYEPLSGAESTFGRHTHQGVELAIDQANKRGGVLGKKLELISYDDQGRSDEAVTAVTKLITLDKVLLIIGENTSSRSIAGGERAEHYQIPMISPSGTNDGVLKVGEFIFRVCFSDAFQGQAMAKFAFKQLGYRRGAIFKDVKNDYSIGFASAFRRYFVSLGGTIMSEETYTSGDIDFRAQLSKIKHAQPDFLFVPGYYTEVGLIATQLREDGNRTVLLGGDGWDSPKLTEIGKDAIVGSYFSSHYTNEDPRPLVQDFLGQYQEAYHELPDSNSATGYDAMNLAIEAIRRSNPLTPLEVRKSLTQIDKLDLVTGTMTVDPNREAVKSVVILQVVKPTHSTTSSTNLETSFKYVTTIEP